MTPYTVSVRALCEFAAKQGDLDLRFAPSPSAQQGVAGHQRVTATRSAGYRAEVTLRGQFDRLIVQGRADGYDAEQGLLEEIKTFRGDLDRMPANHRQLHWAQAKVYAWLLCDKFGLRELKVALVYFDVGEQCEAPALVQSCAAADLQAHFETLCRRFLGWAESELAHRAARDAALATLGFAHPAFRSGQRELAVAVFNAARHGRCLLAQAPTGIGKTVATLFPMLKACASHALDKVYFVTAKGSGRGLALAAVQMLRRQPSALPLRVIELVARDKACEHPDKRCDGQSCPLASGFYDRLPAARAAAIASGAPLTRQSLRQVALAHQICPYHLGHELVRWCDLVVGDYNHFFDSSALLHGLTVANAWRVGLLVDEAHNLVDRARSMYSATLDSELLRRVLAVAPRSLTAPLRRLQTSWRRVAASSAGVYTVLDPPPLSLATALADAVAAMGEHVAEHPTGPDSELLRLYFDALQFARLLETCAEHSVVDLCVSAGAGPDAHSSTLCVRNVVPAPFLRSRFAAVHSAVLFSATLTPQHFYTDMLGLPSDTLQIDVPAPFSADQLTVRIVREVSTRYGDRPASLAPIARLMAEQFSRCPGNYLAFFSSHDYLQQAADAFVALYPAIPTWRQTRLMSDTERENFLARFASDGCGVGFAVLGGAFAEGIDLVGPRLIGAFIVTLGLPQFNPVNEQMRERIDAIGGGGYEAVYLYPGLRKVVQAAGRVVRSLNDRGSVHLIDDRYGRPEVRQLLPPWWQVQM